ncbi:MAG: 50S ribosomal protein L28 [Rickettsiales bacterium]|nr:50S ribosomal protein L28 [Rickettsiales bacterium]|tara:strand:- start:568 stop:864 length:297 start_codon:yes stop_codon:yes gene_type:complete
MTKRCAILGKGPMSGNNVSHANNKTRRRFLPNLQDVSLYSEALGRAIKLRVSMHGLRTVEHNGGIDQYVMKTAKTKLTDELRPYKKVIEEAVARQQAA